MKNEIDLKLFNDAQHILHIKSELNDFVYMFFRLTQSVIMLLLYKNIF